MAFLTGEAPTSRRFVCTAPKIAHSDRHLVAGDFGGVYAAKLGMWYVEAAKCGSVLLYLTREVGHVHRHIFTILEPVI